MRCEPTLGPLRAGQFFAPEPPPQPPFITSSFTNFLLNYFFSVLEIKYCLTVLFFVGGFVCLLFWFGFC